MAIKEKIIIFGTGKCAEKAIDEHKLNEKYEIVAFADNDKNKQGGLFQGKEIISPLYILQEEVDKVIICSQEYKDIKNQINNNKLFNGEILTIEDLLLELYRRTKESLINNLDLLNIQSSNYEEIKEIIDYLKVNELSVFNYKFTKKYLNHEVNVFRCEDSKMFYVIHNGRRMYFKRSMSKMDDVISYYKGICAEQDIKSPHRYLDEEIEVENNDVVIDAGAAEGNFTLEVIDKVSRVYIVEPDKEWVDALKMTFKDYFNKVTIINKFLNSYDDDDNITIDSIVNNSKINFIKMDIEGYEVDALSGAKETLNTRKHLKWDICSYHKYDDEAKIKKILKEYKYDLKTTRGYMFFSLIDIKSLENILKGKEFPFRRGLVRAIK